MMPLLVDGTQLRCLPIHSGLGSAARRVDKMPRRRVNQLPHTHAGQSASIANKIMDGVDNVPCFKEGEKGYLQALAAGRFPQKK